jgi:hypothetical protein
VLQAQPSCSTPHDDPIAQTLARCVATVEGRRGDLPNDSAPAYSTPGGTHSSKSPRSPTAAVASMSPTARTNRSTKSQCVDARPSTHCSRQQPLRDRVGGRRDAEQGRRRRQFGAPYSLASGLRLIRRDGDLVRSPDRNAHLPVLGH